MRFEAMFAALIGFALIGCGSGKSAEGPAAPTASSSPAAQTSKPRFADQVPLDKLKSYDVVIGKGDTCHTGDYVWVQYTGRTQDGTIFDSNEGNGKPLLFFGVGRGKVIKGWNQGIIGMKVGGERELGIPTSLAYGASPPGPQIEPNADLFFHIKLLYVLTPDRTMTFDYEDVKIGTGKEVKAGSIVSVKYTGKLLTGEVFDSTDKHDGKPISFTAGKGEVIAGWEKGLLGVREGGIRHLIIPPSLGYGGQIKNGIPENSVLDFMIEVVSVK